MSNDTDAPVVEEEEFFDPSDEEFEKMSPAEYAALGGDAPASSEEEEKEDKEEKVEEPATEPEPPEEDGDEEEPEEDPNKKDTVDAPVEEDKAVEPKEEVADTAIDYKAAYEELMGTFKANGVEMTPKSIADAKRLQQMGANYHKKMAGMKPALKALKTLENNGLLDEEQLNFLIDINKGNPEAITQLLKKNNINPLDVNTEQEANYTPTDHSASDKELELDEVLEGIHASPNYTRTLTTVTKEWDSASRNEAATKPHIISVINGHMDSGVYDKVMSAVQYDRSCGRLTGISDLEAYKITGNRLDAEGAFNPPVTSIKKTEAELITDPAAQAKEQKRKAQKKAASPTTNSSGRVSDLPSDFNPLDMSDEEFEKFDPKKLGL